MIYVNDEPSGGDTHTHNFTAYVNPYMVVSRAGRYTKHIYIGSQRIVSKLGDMDSYGEDPRRIEYAGTGIESGADNNDFENVPNFCCEDKMQTKSFDPSEKDDPELYQYYYHSDHLGSSSLITNLDGETVQHIEYVPFGEVFIEERNNRWNTPYLFNAKELDEETGLYYYRTLPRILFFFS